MFENCLWMNKLDRNFSTDSHIWINSISLKSVQSEKKKTRQRSKTFFVQIDLEWIQVLSEGWATPLTGFMREKQYLQCLHFGCLVDGMNNEKKMKMNRSFSTNRFIIFLIDLTENQAIPIVLPCSTEDKKRLKASSIIALCYEKQPIAILKHPEFFEHRKEERCARTFGTTDIGHPSIKVKSIEYNFFLFHQTNQFFIDSDDYGQW